MTRLRLPRIIIVKDGDPSTAALAFEFDYGEAKPLVMRMDDDDARELMERLAAGLYQVQAIRMRWH